MATLIDSLVVELSLDPSKFSPRAKQAVDDLNKLEQADSRRSKGQVENTRNVAEAVRGLTTQAIELFGVFTGAVGLKDFVASTINAGSNVGRLSRAIGVSTIEITKWQAVAQEYGSTAENMAGAYQSLSNVFSAWKVGGAEAPQVEAQFRAITTAAQALDATNAQVIDGADNVDTILKKLATNLKIIHDLKKDDPNLASYLAGAIPGMDAGLFDLLVTGSDNVTAALARVRGMTQAEADAAGQLDRQWNNLITTSKRAGQSTVLKALSTDQQDLKSAAGVIDKIFGSHLADHFSADPVNNSNTPVSNNPAASSDPNGYRSAIASIESRGSGGYAAMGPVTRSGDRAYGKYQIMGNNIGPWSQAALGRQITPQEFMASPELQDKIFDHRFGQYVKQFGNPQDAASAWLTGRPLSTGANARDQFGTSGAAYAQRFTAALPGAAANSSSQPPVQITGPITVHGVKDPEDFAAKLRTIGLQRATEANQSSVGGE
jgi:hypothetical protein